LVFISIQDSTLIYILIYVMKGIVFTEFLDMVEQNFGYEMVDTLLNESELPSGGIYTSIGTYNHQEMVNLLVTLNMKTKTPISQLLRTFGRYLFQRFTKIYSHLIDKAPDAFAFLGSIHNYIHVEVRKLYPDAELPHFDIEQPNANTLVMYYSSVRSMGDLAYGLIEGAMKHYGETATITQELLQEDGSQIKFVIEK
jgi:hypothetical protein